MGFLKKLLSKLKSSLYVFKKAEILRNVVNKEIGGEYDNLCHQCYFNERFQEQQQAEGILPDLSRLRISIYLGGALGDYIVYLRLVDELSTVCDCDVDLFLDRIEFGEFIYGNRENVTIVHDVYNNLFVSSTAHYDLALHVDHGAILKHINLGAIRAKAPAFYHTACKIEEALLRNELHISDQHQRESVMLRYAKFSGDTKWSLLSCGGAVDMCGMYSNILLDMRWLPVLERHALTGRRYITVNFGADKNMGGTAQTKLLPVSTLMEFITAFKAKHSDILVVQTGVKNSLALDRADRYAFDCRLEETAILLKSSLLHVDCEGGLVHLASQLSTPCVVSFGPTPSYYYGYPRNENIVSPVCGECMSVTGQWSKVCPRGLQQAVCMAAITPQMLLERAEKILKELPTQGLEPVQMTLRAAVQDVRAGHRVCLLAPLGTETFAAAQALRKRGCNVSVYIPLQLDAKICEMRGALKKQGIRVEYGDAFNVAVATGSFDRVLCQGARISTDLMAFAQDECARLAAVDGQVVWYDAENI
ncbi:hypothetical protein [Oscillibacter sp.]|uniref:glycosyltransferase family 9 protein n=1 Tax=Oscillibacter sp. TaxID=1945593 RepID=UPI00289F1F8C|nr:hypothetical protein [Oscillibacter sp.]